MLFNDSPEPHGGGLFLPKAARDVLCSPFEMRHARSASGARVSPCLHTIVAIGESFSAPQCRMRSFLALTGR